MTGMHSDDVPRRSEAPAVAGLVLAAGSGSRYGMPKALAVDAAGQSWLVRATLAVAAGGCDPVLVVLGAGGAEAESLLRAAAGRFARPDRLRVVHAEHWADGLSASLDAGLAVVQEGADDSVAVALVPVDVPDLSADAVRRLIDGATSHTLRQAHFAGRPGHPVVIGCAHWAPLRASLAGDTGARPYLVAHQVTAVPCDDLGTGRDVDEPSTE